MERFFWDCQICSSLSYFDPSAGHRKETIIKAWWLIAVGNMVFFSQPSVLKSTHVFPMETIMVNNQKFLFNYMEYVSTLWASLLPRDHPSWQMTWMCPWFDLIEDTYDVLCSLQNTFHMLWTPYLQHASNRCFNMVGMDTWLWGRDNARFTAQCTDMFDTVTAAGL